MTVCILAFILIKRKMKLHTHVCTHNNHVFFFLNSSACATSSVFVRNDATVCANLSGTQRTTWQRSRTRLLSTIAVWMRDLVAGGICLILFNSIPSLSVPVQTPLPRYKHPFSATHTHTHTGKATHTPADIQARTHTHTYNAASW